MVVIGFGHIGMSSKKFLSHFAPSTTLSSVINSNFIIELVIHVYLEDFQTMVAPFNVNIYSIIDLVSILSEI